MPDSATAWLDSIGSPGVSADEVMAALERAGVVTVPFGRKENCTAGIVILSEVSDKVCTHIRSCSAGGLNRLLAVTTDQVMASGAAWHILAAGASDVIAWDRLPDVASVVAARLRRWRAVDEIVSSPLVRNNLVGCSPFWISLLRQIVEVAHFTDASILLIGETGTGKELVARLIHALSTKRSKHQLVVLDCTTIVPELSGSELFGHQRGAFTGAVMARDGALALADGGTLFLDEVGELPPGLQAQFLRAVQEHTYKPVGSDTWHKTDFRLICATNRDLLQDEANGRFRRDLYYRIANWTFRLPPLRERLDDILPLASHFIRHLRPDEPPLELDAPVREYLLTQEYHGNVRDLRNMVERMASRHVGTGPITIGDIPPDGRLPMPPDRDAWRAALFEPPVRLALLSGASLREIRQGVEETAIRLAIEQEGGNLQRAAKRLRVTDRALQLRRAEQRHRGPQAESDRTEN